MGFPRIYPIGLPNCFKAVTFSLNFCNIVSDLDNKIG